MLANVRKALVAVGAACTVTLAALADGSVDSTEGVGIALAVLTALGVYAVPNSQD